MSSSQYRLRECEFSTCTDHTEYICETCPHVRFCAQCKESHVNDLKNIDHKIVTYRDKYEFTSCEPPVRFHCTEHDNNQQIHIQNAYEAKQQQCKDRLNFIRSEVLFSRCFLLSEIKADVKKCHNNFSEFHSEMLRRAQKVKDYLDTISYGFHFKHRCLRQIKRCPVILDVYKHMSTNLNTQKRYNHCCL